MNDRVDRDAMLNVFNYMELVVDLRGVKSLYVGSKAYVRVGNEVSEWFPVSGAETGMCDVAVAVQFVY